MKKLVILILLIIMFSLIGVLTMQIHNLLQKEKINQEELTQQVNQYIVQKK